MSLASRYPLSSSPSCWASARSSCGIPVRPASLCPGRQRTGGAADAYRVPPIELSTYIISGFCSALAGIILASRLQTGAPEAGSGEEFDVIAAVIIGGASLFGGRGTLVGTLLGAAFIAVLAKGQTLIGIPANYQSFTRGVVILIAVTLDVLSRRSIVAPRRLRWATIVNPAPLDALSTAEAPHGAPERKTGVPRASGRRTAQIVR